MPTVDVLINNRPYTVACDEGEQPRVRTLAAYVDDHLRHFAGSSASEAHLLALTSIMLADQISDLRAQLESGGAVPPGAHNGAVDVDLAPVTAALETLAGRIESIADRLEQA